MKRNISLEIQLRREKNIKRGKQKLPKWFFPTNEEKSYDKILYHLVKEIKKNVKEILLPEIPSMIDEVNNKTPNDRNDDYLDRLKTLLNYIYVKLEDTIKTTQDASKLISIRISQFNKNQFQKMTKFAFGFDLFVDEPWLEDQLKLFSAQNSQLINSLPEEELNRVAGDVERGLQQGQRFTEVAKTIQKSFGISHRRATLIARDQTTKLNASLTKLRQQEVGITQYQWSTANDDRVRKTHAANNKQIFDWDKPPKITGHPGHDVNCRCVAIPVIEGFI